MKKIARISTAAFLAGATTLAVSLPMPGSAASGAGALSSTVSVQRIAELPIRSETAAIEKE